MSMGIVATAAVVASTGAQIYGANKAAKSQKNAAKLASDTELQMYNQTRDDQAPYREAGYSALNQIGGGLAPGGEFTRDFTMADFVKDPGYDFRMDQGIQARDRSASARGGLNSGAQLKAIERYGQDYASGEYSNAYNRFNADRTTRFNRLATVAGVGQTSLNTTGQIGAGTAGNIGSLQTQSGNAQAAGSIGTANAVSGGVNTLGSFYLQNQYLNGGGGGGAATQPSGWYKGNTYADLNP